MKIHIIGPAGSGKSTLARSLAALDGSIWHDLDYVVYGPQGEQPAARIAQRLQETAAGEGWVTEGAYRSNWLEPLLSSADHIVWLDLPLRVCLWRILARHVRAELRGDNAHPGWRRLIGFLNYTRAVHASSRSETLALLSPYRTKVRRCRGQASVRRLSREGSGFPKARQ